MNELKLFFNKLAEGRINRPQYWKKIALILLIQLALIIVNYTFYYLSDLGVIAKMCFTPLSTMYSICIATPIAFSLTLRRLNDTGSNLKHNKLYVIFVLLMFAGIIYSYFPVLIILEHNFFYLGHFSTPIASLMPLATLLKGSAFNDNIEFESDDIR